MSPWLNWGFKLTLNGYFLGFCQYGSRKMAAMIKSSFFHHSPFIPRRLLIYIKKGIYLLCIKSPDISSPKSICKPLSGSFGRCSWRDLNYSLLDLEEIPVPKHVLSAFIRAKGVNLKGFILHVLIEAVKEHW